MRRRSDAAALTLAGIVLLAAPMSDSAVAAPEMELFRPELTASRHTEVKITISPGNDRILWGVIGVANDEYGGWDIYETRRTHEGWSDARPARRTIWTSAIPRTPRR